jgi:serine/threonine protein kinase
VSSEPAAIPTGTVVAGKLRVVRLLGLGGMGAVYEVEHELTKHRRALKLLHAEMLNHPIVVARFVREASAAGHIGNPHIVETFDAGNLPGGEPYIVMEMLKGETLASRIEKLRRLPLPELVDVIRQACDGVQAAHDVGIVHRDLKPENLFLVDRGGKPFVKILDFGVSKFDPSLTGANGTTKEGSALGTPYYMSPEQVDGDKNLDARTDIYALGVILYECASGKRPFTADALPKLAVLIHEGKPRPLSERRPELPAAFVEVVHKAMARDRDRRFATAGELGAALEPFGAIALDETVPEMGPARVGSSRPPSAVVARSEMPPKLPGLTGDGSALSVAGERMSAKVPSEGTRLSTVALVSVIAGVIGVVAIVLFGRGSLGGAGGGGGGGAAPPPPAVTQAVTAEPPVTSSPAVESLTPLPSATLTTHPSASASASPGPGSKGVRILPAGSAKPGTAASTRAEQRGLAGDNPF